jgi:hypothetical protein
MSRHDRPGHAGASVGTPLLCRAAQQLDEQGRVLEALIEEWAGGGDEETRRRMRPSLAALTERHATVTRLMIQIEALLDWGHDIEAEETSVPLGVAP